MRRFTRPAGERPREEDPALCRFLRALPRVGISAPYWCGKTMRPEGPDNAPAQPEDCTDERPCFEAARVESEG
ncbi:MAG TPA: hypothetical protein VMR54_10305 [Thermoanaerobaculia bacterium]|nr:hypothetical protein [Thermoanaerobaculia bacterium]